jgi:hypothetical protein
LKRLIKPGVVLCGYILAFLMACAALYVHELLEAADQSQASGGMQAFADVSLFLGVFGFLSLAPTTLALCFLRRFSKLWTVFSSIGLALAITLGRYEFCRWFYRNYRLSLTGCTDRLAFGDPHQPSPKF